MLAMGHYVYRDLELLFVINKSDFMIYIPSLELSEGEVKGIN
jgi:hypothetical protein